MINSRKDQVPYPEDWSYGYTDEEVEAMNAVSMATVPVNQIQHDDDDDVITIIKGSGGYSIGGGGSMVGSGMIIGGGGGAYANNSAGQSIQSMVGHLTLDLGISQVPDLPSIVFDGYDFDEKKIVMTLQPESTISTLEVFKILLLINAATHTPSKFSVFAFIKKNNLERHFKFTQ